MDKHAIIEGVTLLYAIINWLATVVEDARSLVQQDAVWRTRMQAYATKNWFGRSFFWVWYAIQIATRAVQKAPTRVWDLLKRL